MIIDSYRLEKSLFQVWRHSVVRAGSFWLADRS